MKKGLIATFMVVLMIVTVLSGVVTAEAFSKSKEEISKKITYTSNRGKDLAIIYIFVDYDWYEGYRIWLTMENVGDENVSYHQIYGTLHLYSFIEGKFKLYNEGMSGQTWNWRPGVRIQKPGLYAPEIGYIRIYLKLTTSGDVNPDNNIIDGLYFIYKTKLTPVNTQYEIKPYNIMFFERFPLLNQILQRFRI